MSRIIDLLRGFPGHPSHPPFTDATIGAYTAGTVLAILGWLGVAERQLSSASYAVIVVGLVFAAGTILTGFLDYLRIRRGTSMRRTANIHWVFTVSSTAIYLAAAALLRGGYDSGRISLGAVLVTVLAWFALLIGGWVGGSIVFVHGMRVQMRPDASPSEAIKPKLPRRGGPAA
jgi:uncharacterized membrane protein